MKKVDSRRLGKGEGPLFGVCGGIGDFISIPPILIRIVFILSPLFVKFYIPFILYFLLAAFLPRSAKRLDSLPENSLISFPNLHDTVVCTSCNHENPQNANFCNKCEKHLY